MRRIQEAGGFDRIANSCSSCRYYRPELLGPALSNVPAKLGGPITFTAEILAPSQHPQCETMQDMFFSKTDRAKHLMCDRSTFRCSFDAANFCRGRFEKCRLIKTVAFSDRIGGGTRDRKRSCGFSSETREILLNCLEFSDRSFEGDALIRIRDRH